MPRFDYRGAFVKARAQVKLQEAREAELQEGEEGEEVEVPREERLGPGGLDPVEVFEELPTSMQEAFAEKDMQKLQAALTAMSPEDCARYMKLCEDSGLWVANANAGADP